jgi:hypothetical protein
VEASNEFSDVLDFDSAVAAAHKALAIYRDLTARGVVSRQDPYFARVLERVGSAYRDSGKRGSQAERRVAYRNCIQYASESRDIYSALQKAGTLPSPYVRRLVLVQNYIEIARAKLSELQTVSVE